MSVRPWSSWYHCMGSTYGTWLPGDPRGFRTRHHREHVDGDYKNPPPQGMYEQRYRESKQLMNREPVYLTFEQRKRALDEFVKSFRKFKIEVAAISIDRIHFHVLLRELDHNPRYYLGLAKKESSAYMKRDGVGPQGGLWGTRTECKPIADERHFQRVVAYILNHGNKGAVVWRGEERPTTMSDFDPDGLLLD